MGYIVENGHKTQNALGGQEHERVFKGQEKKQELQKMKEPKVTDGFTN